MTTNLRRYENLRDTATFYQDSKFCSVIALSLALGLSYEQCWTLLNKEGREHNKGSETIYIFNILNKLNIKYSILKNCHCKTVGKFSFRGNFIIFTRNHALCHQFGETLDHSANSRRIITKIIKIQEIPVGLAEEIIAEKPVNTVNHLLG